MNMLRPRFINQSLKLTYPGTLPSEKELGAFLESIGRTCWKSEERTTDTSWVRFLQMLQDRKHLSVFEHYSFTVRIVTSRSIANELVRHRIAAYSQESTRYVNYTKSDYVNFIIPYKFRGLLKDGFELESITMINEQPITLWPWLLSCDSCARNYAMEVAGGTKPEEARDLLPLGLATEIVATFNIRMWWHVFHMRIAPDAHPLIRELIGMARDELSERFPSLFKK